MTTKLKPLHGTVVFYQPEQDGKRGFGFIRPLGATDRSENVWFGPNQLAGLKAKAGDQVEFEIDGRTDSKGPRASRMWLTKIRPKVYGDDTVTTLHGSDEYY